MKVAVIGSRSLTDLDIACYIPKDTTMIISGGAEGIDTQAEAYADKMGIAKAIIRPDYMHFGKSAPLRRNLVIVDMCECVVAIWDGKSRGTMHTVGYARRTFKKVKLFTIE